MMFLDSYNYTACNALDVVNYLQALAWCLGYDGVPGTEATVHKVQRLMWDARIDEQEATDCYF